jgi:hypothetical protein
MKPKEVLKAFELAQKTKGKGKKVQFKSNTFNHSQTIKTR